MQTLRRSLGLTDVVLFFIVAGSNLQWVAAAAANGPSSLAIWVLGAIVMFVPLAIVVVRLSARYPEEGGLYVWSKHAFGPFAGFMTGYTYWTSNLPYFSALLYFTAGNAAYIAGSGGSALANSPLYFIIVSLGGLALATVMNVYGLDVGKWLSNIGGLCRWAVTLLLFAVGAAVWWRFGAANVMNAHTVMPAFSLKNIIFLSIIAFAWIGPESVTFMGGEIKNPRRNIPLGLAIAAPVIAAIYIVGTFSVLTILRAGDVNASSGVMQSISHAATRFGFGVLTPVAAILVTVSCLGSVGAWLGSTARIPFVAGIDKYLPDAFGRMHPRWHSPVVALLVQSALAAVFIVLGQGGTTVKSAYDVLVSVTVIVSLLPFVYMFATAWKLREGSVLLGAAAVVGSLTTLLSIVVSAIPANDDPNKPLAVAKVVVLTLVLIGAGILLYGRRKKTVA